MLQVPPIKREAIDQWPVAESGLPVRVVNSVTPEGVTKIGQLRTWSDQQLLSLRSLGRISLGHVRAFFKLCGQIEQGKQSFQNIQEVLAIFLDGPELKVLSSRYGFDRRDLVAGRNKATLQEIGNTEHRTRERIRQVQETAKKKLQSRLSAVCLQPFFDFFCGYITERGGAVACADLAPIQNEATLAGHNVCGVLLLLSDLNAARIAYYHGFFSTLPEPALQTLESQALAVLTKEARPVPLDAILKGIPGIPQLEHPGGTRLPVMYLMDHCPDAAATVDNRYFLFSGGTQPFLVEIMKELERPAHYRTVTNAFNERVKPLSRKGAGFILEMLNSNPQCTRVDRGIYDLKAE
jgi:hypothetical protein